MDMPPDVSQSAEASLGARLAGKYMAFKLASEEYGIEILKVREIIGLMEITAMPRTPVYMRGVINLRGRVIPVVDLRLKFALPGVDTTDQTVIIVVQFEQAGRGVTIGLLVDEVLEVLNVPEAAIEPAPHFGDDETDFILGIGKTGARLTMLLDIPRILGTNDVLGVLGAMGQS